MNPSPKKKYNLKNIELAGSTKSDWFDQPPITQSVFVIEKYRTIFSHLLLHLSSSCYYSITLLQFYYYTC